MRRKRRGGWQGRGLGRRGGGGHRAVDEIEDIPVGETQSLTVDLDAGSYVLICNIYTEDEQESHYQEGMRASFTVE